MSNLKLCSTSKYIMIYLRYYYVHFLLKKCWTPNSKLNLYLNSTFLISTYFSSIVTKHVHCNYPKPNQNLVFYFYIFQFHCHNYVHVINQATFILLVMELAIYLLLLYQDIWWCTHWPSADPNSSVISWVDHVWESCISGNSKVTEWERVGKTRR